MTSLTKGTRIKTSTEIPVPSYVKKWLVNSYNYNEAISMDTRVIFETTDTKKEAKEAAKTINQYYDELYIVSRGEDKDESRGPILVTINILIEYNNIAKSYTMAMLLHQLFWLQVYNAINTSILDRTINAKQALRRFLATNDINEFDLKLDTAYKRWQRNNEKTKLPLMTCK